jgi:hypothetical protein
MQADDHPIHDAVLRFISDPGSARFETLALEVFAHQFECVPAYRHVCERRGTTRAVVRDWRDIPPVPALAFKHLDLGCAEPQRVFLTTGTSSGAGQRGRHAMPDLRLYHAAALAGMSEFLFPDVEAMPILSLVAASAECPDSSLAQMIAWALEHFGRVPGNQVFASAGQLDFAGFTAALRQSERDGVPVCIMTTTGALVRFFDHCRVQGVAFRLPHGSRLMDTGGSKGAGRPLSAAGVLYACWNTLAIPGYFCVNEYGMTELSSQYYDTVIRDRYAGRFTRRAKAGPHWLRPRVLDPGSLREVPAGQPGLLCHFDLANAGTVLAVLTEDVGYTVENGFVITGRMAGADARGCALALADFVT